MDEIVNKVANSGLITLDLGEYYPEGDRVIIDLKDQLWQGMAIREKDFRDFVKTTNWEEYTDKQVAVTCSADAIVPVWCYMLVSQALDGIAKTIVFGDAPSLEAELWRQSLSSINPEEYRDERVIIKGCSKRPVSPEAFVYLTQVLKSKAKSIMYGEPCSTVPIYKRPRG